MSESEYCEEESEEEEEEEEEERDNDESDAEDEEEMMKVSDDEESSDEEDSKHTRKITRKKNRTKKPKASTKAPKSSKGEKTSKSRKSPKSPRISLSAVTATDLGEDCSSTLELIEQCYEYTKKPVPPGTYATRRSLFRDEEWLQNMMTTAPPNAISMQQWFEKYPQIRFPKTDIAIQKKSNPSDQLRLSSYSCAQFCRDEDPSTRPMPKKKTGKKAKNDSSNETYKTIMQIYEKNQFYIHAGGAVNAIQFSETFYINEDENTCTQYFLVCTSEIGWCGDISDSNISIPTHLHNMGVGYDYPHEVVESTSSVAQAPNMLQVYEVVTCLNDPIRSTIENEVSSSILSVKPVYFVGFSTSGPLWDAKWCPEDNFQRLKDEDAVLGTVALVSGDGKCRVLVLPMPHVICTDQIVASSTSSPIPENLRDVPMLLDTELCRWEFKLPTESALCVAWGGGNGAKGKDGIYPLLLGVGLSSGSIATWNLSLPCLRHSVLEAQQAQSQSIDENFDKKVVKPIIPLMKFVDLTTRVGNTETAHSRASLCGVRALSFCPYDGQLFASGGYDGALKVWSIYDRFCPIYTRDQSATWLYALEWNKNGCGIMWGSAGSPTVHFDLVWLDLHSSRYVAHTHPSLYSGINKIYNFSDDKNYYMNLSCSVSSDGSLIGSSYPLHKKRRKKIDSLQYFRINDVTMQEEYVSSTGEDPKVKKYCEIIIDDKIKENKSDLSSKIFSSPISLLCLHAMEIPQSSTFSTRFSEDQEQRSDRERARVRKPTPLDGFHLMACGGHAGLIRLQFFHSSCFHPRIQLFQNDEINK